MEKLLLEYEGAFSHGHTLDSIVDFVESLPALPDVAARALRLLEDPDTTPTEVGNVIRLDPAFTSITLKAANSASLGTAEVISDLSEAVMVVGFAALKAKLLAATLRNWNRNKGSIQTLIWEKSLGTASAAQAISAHLGKSYQTEAYLTGLLHNLGQIVMVSHPALREEYSAVLRYVCENGVNYAEAERQVIGFSYPLVGGLLARRWNLPYSTCVCLLRHDDPFEAIENRQDEQIVLTKLAATTAMCAGLGCPMGHPLFCDSLAGLAIAIGFSPERLEEDKEVVIRQTKALYANEAAILVH